MPEQRNPQGATGPGKSNPNPTSPSNIGDQSNPTNPNQGPGQGQPQDRGYGQGQGTEQGKGQGQSNKGNRFGEDQPGQGAQQRPLPAQEDPGRGGPDDAGQYED